MTQNLLDMIETADVSDTNKLDEIDVLFWQWFTGIPVARIDDYEGKIAWSVENSFYDKDNRFDLIYLLPTDSPMGRVSRSRDALKAIRPDGWIFESYVLDPWGSKRLYRYRGFKHFFKNTQYEDGSFAFFSGFHSKSEELAELGAIIKAIERERAVNSIAQIDEKL